MKIKRHPDKLPIKVLSTALALSLATNFAATLAVVDKNAAAEQAINVAERAVDHTNYYRNKLVDLQVSYDKLESDNANLTRALDAHSGAYIKWYAETPPRYIADTLEEPLQDYIWELCCSYDIAEYYELVYAIIKKESNFNASAVSTTGDYGLMQINKCNHAWLVDALDLGPSLDGTTEGIFLSSFDNVLAGIHILAPLLHKYDVPDALMAYNMGPGGAKRLWERGIHNTSYSDQVLDYYNQIKK